MPWNIYLASLNEAESTVKKLSSSFSYAAISLKVVIVGYITEEIFWSSRPLVKTFDAAELNWKQKTL